MMRPSINPFTFLSILGCVSSGRIEIVSIQFHHLMKNEIRGNLPYCIGHIENRKIHGDHNAPDHNS